jgi:hypothetical protein
MAITASTSAKNRVYRSDARKSFFEDAQSVVSSAVTWYQGDLLYFDDATNLIKVVAATGNAATFLGIADNTVSAGKLVGPYAGLTAVNAAEAISALVGPSFGVEALMKLKSGDVFAPGDKVYLTEGGDSQTVTSTDPGGDLFIGQYQGATVTATATSEGVILLYGRGKTGTVNF